MNTEGYEKLIINKFAFLEYDYGFEFVSSEDNQNFYKIIYKNPTTGVAITYEYREANIFVYLYKLVNGQMLEDVIPISEEIPLNSIELNYIVQYKNKESLTMPLYAEPGNTFEDLVSRAAGNLKKCADDILKGNFSIFCEVDSLAKKRRLEWQKNL